MIKQMELSISRKVDSTLWKQFSAIVKYVSVATFLHFTSKMQKYIQHKMICAKSTLSKAS